MSQVKNGLRSILQHANVYTFFQNFLGTKKARKEFINNYLKLRKGLHVLDVGCGPCDTLGSIDCDINYTGIDFEESYINFAQNKYGTRGKFILADVNSFDFGESKYDRIIITGVLHHLEDIDVKVLMSNLSKILSPDGAIICLENVYIPNQNIIAKKIISLDRGRNIRTHDGYINLLSPSFKHIECIIRNDMLRIPYTHIIMKMFN